MHGGLFNIDPSNVSISIPNFYDRYPLISNPIILRRRVLLSLDNHENWKWLNRVFCPTARWYMAKTISCSGVGDAQELQKTIRLFRILRARCWLLLVKQDSAGHCGAMRKCFRHSNRRRFGAKTSLPSHQRNKGPQNREGHFPLKLGDSQVLCWLWGRWYPGEVLTFTPFPEHHHGTCYTYTILHAHTNRWTYVWSVYTGIYTTKTSGEQ